MIQPEAAEPKDQSKIKVEKTDKKMTEGSSLTWPTKQDHIAHSYATHFSKVYETLTKEQKEKLI